MTSWSRIGATIAFWYTSNIVVVISNKYLLTNYGFKYPIFLTGCHMVACTILAFITSATGLVPKQSINNFRQFWKIVLLGCMFCLSVVLGNVSLRYIPVSFSQTIGATTPLFTAFISFVLLYHAESSRVYASLIPVDLGLVLATQGEPLLNMTGFVTAVTATFARGFKSVISGMLLTDPSEKMNSMNLLLHMAPIAATAILPAVLIQESDALQAVRKHASLDPYFLPALAINAALSFTVNLSGFMVTKQTSALTLQVLGNAKGVVAAAISIFIFRNPVTLRGGLGYAIALAGVALYTRAKAMSPGAEPVRDPLEFVSHCKSPLPSQDLSTSLANSPMIKSHPLAQRSPTKGFTAVQNLSTSHTIDVFAHAMRSPRHVVKSESPLEMEV